MTTNELMEILAQHPDLLVAIRLDGFNWYEDPRSSYNERPGWLEHSKALSDCRNLATEDVSATWQSDGGKSVLEIAVRVHVGADCDKYGEPTASISLMGAEEVAGVNR
jgi:hypothetical protein